MQKLSFQRADRFVPQRNDPLNHALKTSPIPLCWLIESLIIIPVRPKYISCQGSATQTCLNIMYIELCTCLFIYIYKTCRYYMYTHNYDYVCSTYLYIYMILLILYDLCLKPSTSTAVIIPTASTGLCPYPKRTSLTFNNTEGGVQGFPWHLLRCI